MPYIYWDSTYILVVIGAVICMIASARVKTTFNKYSAYRSMSGMTGAQAAERILHAAGIYDVRVQHVSGNLTDHYNPANKTLNLSDSVCNQTSVAAVGVAAHECGHAIQHARGYVPLRLRTAFVPIANFGSMLAWPVIILGVIIEALHCSAAEAQGEEYVEEVLSSQSLECSSQFRLEDDDQSDNTCIQEFGSEP